MSKVRDTASSRSSVSEKGHKKAHSEHLATTATIENGAKRVFVQSPRLFSFSHRCLQSLRHPFLAVVVQQVEQELAKMKKAWQSKGERLSDLLTDGTSSLRFEEDRWRQIGQMLDSVLFEEDIANRRQSALECTTLRRSLENWWCKAGGTTRSGVRENAYRQIHSLLYSIILQINDTSLTSVVNKAIDVEWNLDCDGKHEVAFGRWYISLLEIADNWISACDGEAYGQYLDSLLVLVFPSVPRVPMLNSSNETKEWQQVVEFLKRNAKESTDPPLVRAVRSVRHTVAYEKVPVEKECIE